MRLLQQAAPDRVGSYDLENADGVPIYVHAKICVVDDGWLTCGSDNFNRRSWTNDSELTCAVIDTTLDEREPQDLSGSGDRARRLARDLRLEVWSEHLGLDRDDPELLDTDAAFEKWRRTAADLDAWQRAASWARARPGRSGATSRTRCPGCRRSGPGRCTGWSTTPTAGRGGSAVRAASELGRVLSGGRMPAAGENVPGPDVRLPAAGSDLRVRGAAEVP